MSSATGDAHRRDRFVDDLLSYMTLAEKLGQLDLFHRADDASLEAAVIEGLVGGVAGGDATANARLRTLATDRSRLGIPLFLVEPPRAQPLSGWALAASWDAEVGRSVGAAVAREAAAGGYNCIFAPDIGSGGGPSGASVDMGGELVHLHACLAREFAQGAATVEAQGRGSVLAMPAWESDRDANRLSWALDLTADGSVKAIDCPAFDRTVARRSGYSGMSIAECRRIVGLVEREFERTSVRSRPEAAERAVAAGRLEEGAIDAAVRGVLSAKHACGLFGDARSACSCEPLPAAVPIDPETIRKTFVLLRNEAGILPLSPVSDKVLVVGSGDEASRACAEALSRGGIGHAIAPGLAQRLDDQTWSEPVAGDSLAQSLASDAARRADFVVVVIDDRHFEAAGHGDRRQPTAVALGMLRALASSRTRLVAIIATHDPVDLGAADQFFAAALQCWTPAPGFEEALSDVLCGRFGPQGRMPANAGRYRAGHGLGFGESQLSAVTVLAGDAHIHVAAEVRNTGVFPMRETIQVYRDDGDGHPRLIAFTHVAIPPSEEAPIALDIGIAALELRSAADAHGLSGEWYEILVGKNPERLTRHRIHLPQSGRRNPERRDIPGLRLASG